MNGALKSCPYCDGELRLFATTTDVKLYLNTKYSAKAIEVECMPCPQNAVCCFHNVPTRMVIAIKFCLMCGRKL